MELRYYLTLLRRWAWLLVLSVVLGAGAALVFSRMQSPVYEAVTWVMIVRPQETSVTAGSSLSDQQLADTYVALLTRRPVLEAASREVGTEVTEDQVRAQLVRGTRMLEVAVEAEDPEQAATIANTLVRVLVEENEALQATEFASTEAALEAQIAQVQERMDALQASIEARKETVVADSTAQQEELAARMDTLQRESAQLQQEIDALELPQLAPGEQAELVAARAEQAQLQLQLLVEQSAYEARLAAEPTTRDAATEAEMLALAQQITDVQETIEELTAERPVMDPASQAQLVEARAGLAQRQLALQTATTRYLQLEARIIEAQDEESGGTPHEQATMSLYEQLYGSLLGSFESVRLARLQNTSRLAVVEEAAAPEFPVRPRVLVNTVLGGLVALMVALGLVLALDYLDASVKSAADVTALTGLPVLGAIETTGRGETPLPGRVVAEPDSRLAESFRTLRANLAFAGAGEQLRTILVTSPEVGDGKTTVASNLAVTLARAGKEVLLVDGDLRDPALHRLFRLGAEGATPVSLGNHQGEAMAQPWPELPNLHVLTSKRLPRRPRELLDAARMAELVGELESAADVVVVDSSPLVVADAAMLAAHADGVLLVVRPGKTSAEGLLAAVEQLGRAGTPVLGVALNRSPKRSRFYQAPAAGSLVGGYGPAVPAAPDGNGREEVGVPSFEVREADG
jgi:polysaccharide biosynthesis transport protein